MSTAYSPPDPNKRRNVMIAALAAVVVVVAAILILVSSGDSNSGSGVPAANAPLNGLKETKAMLDGIPQNGNALGKPNAPVGEGTVKWKEIFELCETTGKTEWYIVEQEGYAGTPLASVQNCIDNLRKMGK